MPLILYVYKDLEKYKETRIKYLHKKEVINRTYLKWAKEEDELFMQDITIEELVRIFNRTNGNIL